MSKVQHYRQYHPDYNSTNPDAMFYKRVYAAIILFQLTEEIPLVELGDDVLFIPNNKKNYNTSNVGAGNGNSKPTGASSRAGQHGKIHVTHPHLH